MKRSLHGGRPRRAARRKMAISTVFALIRDLFAERRNELAKHSPQPADTRAVLLEDIAIEHHGRMLELVELANRISTLGFQHFGQRLNLLSVDDSVGCPASDRKGAL